jgi:hypothetical protein
MGTMLGLGHAASGWRTVVLVAALPWLAACTLGQTGARPSSVVATAAPDGIALSSRRAVLFYRQPEPG